MTAHNRLVYAIIAALGVANIAFGLTFQIIPLAMAAEGDSHFLIGLNGLVGQIGVLISGLNLARLRQRFDSHAVVMAGLGLCLLCAAAFSITQPVWWWFPIRLFTGLGLAVIFTTGESWLQHIAGDKARGRVLGTYLTSQTFTFAIGPFILSYVGASGLLPWIIVIVALLVGAVLMARLKITEIPRAQNASGFWHILHRGKFLFLCIWAATIFDGMVLNFFVLYANNAGMALDNAALLLSVSLALCMLFFFAIGWLGDHWSRYGTIFICVVVEIIGSLMQIPLIPTIWIWPLAVIIRAAAFGVYLSGFGLLGDRFKGGELVAATGVVSVIWGVGAGLSGWLSGFAFDLYGIELLPWLMAACYVPVLLVLGIMWMMPARA